MGTAGTPAPPLAAAVSVGLAAGGLTLVPAAIVFLAASMAGAPTLVVLALVAPMSVGLVVAIVVLGARLLGAR